MDTHTLLSRWPSYAVVAQDAGGIVTREAVKKWAERGRIPAQYHLALAQAAKRRKIGVTLEDIARAAAPRAAA